MPSLWRRSPASTPSWAAGTPHHPYINHHEKYDVPEEVLKRGAAMYAQFAADYLEANA